jgi:hypothetical protein
MDGQDEKGTKENQESREQVQDQGNSRSNGAVFREQQVVSKLLS